MKAKSFRAVAGVVLIFSATVFSAACGKEHGSSITGLTPGTIPPKQDSVASWKYVGFLQDNCYTASNAAGGGNRLAISCDVPASGTGPELEIYDMGSSALVRKIPLGNGDNKTRRFASDLTGQYWMVQDSDSSFALHRASDWSTVFSTTSTKIKSCGLTAAQVADSAHVEVGTGCSELLFFTNGQVSGTMPFADNPSYGIEAIRRSPNGFWDLVTRSNGCFAVVSVASGQKLEDSCLGPATRDRNFGRAAIKDAAWWTNSSGTLYVALGSRDSTVTMLTVVPAQAAPVLNDSTARQIKMPNAVMRLAPVSNGVVVGMGSRSVSLLDPTTGNKVTDLQGQFDPEVGLPVDSQGRLFICYQKAGGCNINALSK